MKYKTVREKDCWTVGYNADTRPWWTWIVSAKFYGHKARSYAIAHAKMLSNEPTQAGRE